MPEVQKNESREQIKKLDKHRNINQTIAVVNLDKGWTKNDSETVNMGDGVVESLKQNCFL